MRGCCRRSDVGDGTLHRDLRCGAWAVTRGSRGVTWLSRAGEVLVRVFAGFACVGLVACSLLLRRGRTRCSLGAFAYRQLCLEHGMTASIRFGRALAAPLVFAALLGGCDPAGP